MKYLKLVVALVFVMGLITGWILGLVKFIKSDFQAPYKAEVIYGLGIVTGFNGVVGWINIED